MRLLEATLTCVVQRITKKTTCFFYLLTTRNANTTTLQSMAKIKEKVLLITGSNSHEYDRPRKHRSLAPRRMRHIRKSAPFLVHICMLDRFIILRWCYTKSDTRQSEGNSLRRSNSSATSRSLHCFSTWLYTIASVRQIALRKRYLRGKIYYVLYKI